MLRIAWLVFVNAARTVGFRELLAKALIHDPLTIFMFVALFRPTGADGDWLSALAGAYPYFTVLFGLTNGFGSWENDVFAGVGPYYVGRRRGVLASRLLFALAGLPSLLLVVVAIWFHLPKVHLCLLGLLYLGSTLLAAAAGFRFGFKTEKSINNFSNLVIWLLALGQTLFAHPLSFLFNWIIPGALVSRGHLVPEFLKGLAMLVAGGALLHFAARPRRSPFFQR